VVQLKTRPLNDLDSLLTFIGAGNLRRFTRLNARVLTLPANALNALAARADIAYLAPDRPAFVLGHITNTTGTEAIRTQTSPGLLGLLPITTTYDGAGIRIAIVDSGIAANHVAFRDALGFSRVVLSRDFTGENRTDDPYGHGTHVASAVAGSDAPYSGAYAGVAPGAGLVNLRVLNAQGIGTTASVLAALDWVLLNHTLYNIRVVNMSIGLPAVDSYMNDPVCLAVRQLVDAGVVVVAAAGNNGKDGAGQKTYGRIHAPGDEPAAVTVGASNSYGTDWRGDDTVTTYSSRGPTRGHWTDVNGAPHYDNLVKPDLVAPGNRVVWAEAPNNALVATHPELDAGMSQQADRRMMYLSGTSMSAPVVAGAAALLLQANPSLTPNMVKALLMYTAQPLAGFNTFEQGAGEVNVAGAVELAKLVRSDAPLVGLKGAPLLNSAPPAPQTNIAGQTFTWAQGLVLNHTCAGGADLITKYQSVYGAGHVLGDGAAEAESQQLVNTTLMTGGISLDPALRTSDGTTLDSGPPFMEAGWLITSGIIIGDGIVIGDGIIVGDSVVSGEGIVIGDTYAQAQAAMIDGDPTTAMH
jgi:serine protease AprX